MPSNVCYLDILDITKLKYVYYQIKLNSKQKEKFVFYDLFLTSNLFTIMYILRNCQYHHLHYNIFLIHDPKFRIIMSENINDKIVNHLCSQFLLFPVLEKKMIKTSVATREGLGTKAGLFYIKKYINSLKENYNHFYVLKCDVHKFFYSIDHNCLMEKMKKIYLDEDILKLLKEIINSTNEEYVNQKIEKEIEKTKKKIIQSKLSLKEKEKKIQELNRIPRYEKGKGLPIGNVSSQILATYYLSDIDHFIKEKLHIKYYVRYMDDFILMHPDREYLKFCYQEISKKLAEIKLHFNQKTQLVEIHQGFTFLGYQFVLKEKRLIVRLNKKTKRKIFQECKHKSLKEKEEIIKKYNGILKHCDSTGYIFKLKFFNNNN